MQRSLKKVKHEQKSLKTAEKSSSSSFRVLRWSKYTTDECLCVCFCKTFFKMLLGCLHTSKKSPTKAKNTKTMIKHLFCRTIQPEPHLLTTGTRMKDSDRSSQPVAPGKSYKSSGSEYQNWCRYPVGNQEVCC